MGYHISQQRTATNFMTRRSFLEVGALALAQAGFGFAAEAKAPRFLLEWGKKGTKPAEFHFPIGIAITAADEILVTDNKNQRVQKFSTEGKFLKAFTVPRSPGGIALDQTGNIYVAHLLLDKVCVYSEEGKPLREWGKTGKGEGELKQPGGIVVHPDGSVYVADMENSRLQKFTSKGKFVTQWGEYGLKPGQFGGNGSPKSRVTGPNFLALDRQGNIYTTEGSVGRVQKFTAAGKYLLSWGNNDDKPGSFGGFFDRYPERKPQMQGPVGICTDKQDRLWVSALSGRVQQFTSEGKYLRGFGERGTKPGQFYAPHALAFDSRGNLYIVDASNNRIQKFAV